MSHDDELREWRGKNPDQPGRYEGGCAILAFLLASVPVGLTGSLVYVLM